MTLNEFSSHKNFPLCMLAFAVSLYGSAEATAQVLEEVMMTSVHWAEGLARSRQEPMKPAGVH